MISAPTHYRIFADGYTPNTFRLDLPTARADAFKYMARRKHKGNPIGDLIKCYHYITIAIEREEKPAPETIKTPQGVERNTEEAISEACDTELARELEEPLIVIACEGTGLLEALAEDVLVLLFALTVCDSEAYEDATVSDVQRMRELHEDMLKAGLRRLACGPSYSPAREVIMNVQIRD